MRNDNATPEWAYSEVLVNKGFDYLYTLNVAVDVH